MTTGNAAVGHLTGAVLGLLADAPAGLSDAELCAALTPAHPGLRPQRLNQLCRRLAERGILERVGVRPIRNRLAGAGAASPDAAPGPAVAGSPTLAARPHRVRAGMAPAFARRHAVGTRHSPPVPDAVPTPDPEGNSVVPRRDPALGWTRTINVTAAVTAWLRRRGATVRRIDVDGTAHDLVVTLDGDDVHVEITGWPPEGGRTHPATTAGAWFAAAADAATARSRAHPRARIVVAVPETRRYRTLAEQRAASLTAARAEVWFVAADGSMRLD